jgi:hypothetical protein
METDNIKKGKPRGTRKGFKLGSRVIVVKHRDGRQEFYRTVVAAAVSLSVSSAALRVMMSRDGGCFRGRKYWVWPQAVLG